MEKELEKNIDVLTKDIKSYIPDNIIEILGTYAFSLIMALLVFIIGKWAVNKIVSLFGNVLRRVKGMDETLIRFLENIVYYSLMIVVLLTSLGKLGVETTSFLAILGAAGLAIGLALKDSLGNFASGVMIIMFKPFKVGDAVTAAGVTGTVSEVGIFNSIFLENFVERFTSRGRTSENAGMRSTSSNVNPSKAILSAINDIRFRY